MENKKIAVNVVGHIKNETGLGEGSRLTIEALKQAGNDINIYNFDNENSPARQNDSTYDKYLSNDLKHDISIINMNADQLIDSKYDLPKRIWDTYRIGIWYWELTEFPDDWLDAFKYVNEIWAPTRFIQSTLLKKTTVPVVYMPPGLTRNEPLKEYDRKYFNLPENTFLFLNFFDMLSFESRKNPLASINAFKKAFKADDMSVGLVLKISYSDKVNGVEKIKELTKGYKNIYVIDKTVSRDEINGLISCCDASISLHRSEGLGLLCEESMYYGKPVIATAWSGNMDFMNEKNSCLVDYDLVKISTYYGNNNPNQSWAEPKIETAVNYMKKLVSDKVYYDELAKNAKETIRNDFSSLKCGLRMNKRLEMILEDKDNWNISPILEISKSNSTLSYKEALNNVNTFSNINFYRNIGNNPIKKIIRKAVTFLINPIVWEQNMYNTSLLRIIEELDNNNKENMKYMSSYINREMRNVSEDIEKSLKEK